jgi:hypothetical protein
MVESVYQKTHRHPERSEEGQFNTIYDLFYRVLQNSIPSGSDNCMSVTQQALHLLFRHNQKSYFARSANFVSSDVKLTLIWQQIVLNMQLSDSSLIW